MLKTSLWSVVHPIIEKSKLLNLFFYAYLVIGLENRALCPPAGLAEKGYQNTCSDSRTDDTGDIAGHGILKDMIVRIVFQSNIISDSWGHRDGAEARSSDEGIDLFSGKEIVDLDCKDPSQDRDSKSNEATYNDQ